VHVGRPPKRQVQTPSATRRPVTPRLVGLPAWPRAQPGVRQPVRRPMQEVEAQPRVSAQGMVARLRALMSVVRMSVVRLAAWPRAQPEKGLRELVLALQVWLQALMPV